MSYSRKAIDDIKARLSVSSVVSESVSLERQMNGEWRGKSPFKEEKTPSFTVNDQKGFYHCFSTGEHGDHFKFLEITRGLTFWEAIEYLAPKAGVVLERQNGNQDTGFSEALSAADAAAKFYREALLSSRGRAARNYLQQRGITQETSKAFELGFAPAERGGLKSYLLKRGITVKSMMDAGLLATGDARADSYDRFRERLMFPITDMRNRVIGFGARAIRDGQQPKYLNSSETLLFKKGKGLYNIFHAMGRMSAKREVLLVEGYLDVIALYQHGYQRAVAPLGTAVTDDQLQVLWRLSDEPYVVMDGDDAGQKAASKLLDMSLRKVEPGRSINFVSLPEGIDPDDLLRAGGPEAVQKMLVEAVPAVDYLWERELKRETLGTPERLAGFEQRIGNAVRSVQDPNVQQHYKIEFRQRVLALRSRPRAQALSSQGNSWQSNASKINGSKANGSNVNGSKANGNKSSSAANRDNFGQSRTSNSMRGRKATLVNENEAAIIGYILRKPSVGVRLEEFWPGSDDETIAWRLINQLLDLINDIETSGREVDSVVLEHAIKKSEIAFPIESVRNQPSFGYAYQAAGAVDFDEDELVNSLQKTYRQSALSREIEREKERLMNSPSRESHERLIYLVSQRETN